jgi:tetratricopeptide (TPR) repeat protein
LALLREGKRILEQLDIAERDPLFAKTRLTLAEIQFSLGEYQNALDLYTLLIDKMRIDDAKVLEFRARTFEKLGNEAAAARDRQKAKTLREKIN